MEETTSAAPVDTARRELIGRIGNSLGRVLRLELPDVSESTRLMEDLNLDSTNVLELLLDLEDEFDIMIDVEGIERPDFDTVGTLADMVSRQSAAN